MVDGSDTKRRLPGALDVAALGVVFGDIGTSPLYAFREAIIAADGTSAPAEAQVLGILSLIFWTITIVVTLKYVVILLRADHDGEGGILALLTLVRPNPSKPTGRLLIFVGLLGAAALLGDGALTPAISVLSAVEGLEVVVPSLAHLIVPLAVSIMVALFVAQRFGTSPISRLFGPVMLVWFVAIGALGFSEIARYPQVLAALDPRFGFELLLRRPSSALAIIGAVFLAVTGGEALYADLGQFGRVVIQRAWFAAALPGLLLNYFGQGAVLLGSPATISNPFFALIPSALGIPMLVLATLATIVASQAIITGAFSLAKQSADLGYLPPMHIRYTSLNNEREIYVGRANAILAVTTIMIIVGFRSSTNLASAYGIAVSITMVATAVLFIAHAYTGDGRSSLGLTILMLMLLLVDLGLATANLTKFGDGGWLPLGLAAMIILIMVSWRRGLKLTAARRRAESRLELARHSVPGRLVPKTAIFLAESGEAIPSSLALLDDIVGIRFARSIVVTVAITSRPRVPSASRARCARLAEGLIKIDVSFGYLQATQLPAVLVPMLREMGIEAGKAIYIVGLDSITGPESIRSIGDLLAKLAAFLARNTEPDVDRFALPPSRTIVLGRRLQV
jgi:KUP system potassium uptake protein